MKLNIKILYAASLLLLTGLGFQGKANTAIKYVEPKAINVGADTVNIEVMNVRKNSIHLSANSTIDGILFTNSLNDQPLEFYVFDLDGTLIHHSLLSSKEKKNLALLKKGIYLYDLFYKDESIEQGKITVK